MDAAKIRLLAQDASLPEAAVAATVALFEKGYTVPFIARYRKEAAGGLDESRIIAVHERFMQHRELLDRQETLVKLVADQGKLSDALRERIQSCTDRFELEDLFLLHRPKRKSRAAEAVARGLEPLAEYIWMQEPDAWSLEEHADVFIEPEKGVADRDQALRGAADIIAEWIAENSEIRGALREMLWKDGFVVSTVVPAKAEQKTKYNMYYDRREPVPRIPSHRVLAIRRGSKEGVLTSSIQGDNAAALRLVFGQVIRDPESPFAPVIEAAARDSYFRILRPLIETEVRAMLKQSADREAIRVFRQNLENLMLASPAGPVMVIGIESGKGEDCTLAVVDGNGNLLEEAKISPLPPKNDMEGTKNVLRDLIGRHGVSAIALGSGASARQVESAVRQALAEEDLQQVLIAAVNDAGVTVYSTSRGAREEYPEQSASTRAAISIARRLQDPLAEMVKIDPKLIGVGQYQHDVDQKELHRGLMQTVQSCVNRVGINPNRADVTLLRYVAGLNERLARRIVDYRQANGPFTSRAAIQSIPGLGEFTCQQAVGFLRIPESENPLDATAIHPEWYPIV
ncbi:MAG: RNA-binding transcriptional accessory protein, partial [Acidobacteria bacterium]|nr:RNA-binding transcriptional accessory protein [Acidobacteriota bacterium]